MISFNQLPDIKDDDFTHFLSRNTQLTKKPKSIYKLHINLDDASFIKHRDDIVNYLYSLGYLDILRGFKYHTLTLDLLKTHDYYQDLLKLLAVIKDTLNNIKADTTKIKTIYLNNFLTKLLTLTTNKQLNLDKLKLAEAKFLADKASFDRFIGQTQFTLYLPKEIQEQTLSEFCCALDKKLFALGAQPGTLPNTDLHLTPFISFRLTQFHNSDLMIHGVEDDMEKHTVVINKLKDEAQQSTLYKTLLKGVAFNPPESLKKAIDEEINEIEKDPNPPAKQKVKQLKQALEETLSHLSSIKTAEEFINFSQDKKSSIKTLLSTPHVSHLLKPSTDTLAEKKIEKLAKDIDALQKKTEEPCMKKLRMEPHEGTYRRWLEFAGANLYHKHYNEASRGLCVVYNYLSSLPNLNPQKQSVLDAVKKVLLDIATYCPTLKESIDNTLTPMTKTSPKLG